VNTESGDGGRWREETSVVMMLLLLVYVGWLFVCLVFETQKGRAKTSPLKTKAKSKPKPRFIYVYKNTLCASLFTFFPPTLFLTLHFPSLPRHTPYSSTSTPTGAWSLNPTVTWSKINESNTLGTPPSFPPSFSSPPIIFRLAKK